MKSEFKTIIIASLVCLMCELNLANTGYTEEILIVAHPAVSEIGLSPNEIVNIFLGKTVKWTNDDIITIVISEDAELHKKFLKKYVKRNTNQFKNVWRRNLFLGKGIQPVSVSSIDELVEYVLKNKGAISYVSSDQKIPPEIKIMSN